jgi:hypothetical protein
MPAPQSTRPQIMQYDRRTIIRAERAVRCAPFRLRLFETMQWQGVDLMAIAGQPGITNGYTRRYLPELVAESELLWLVQVGLLRREVDGQGLTNSFRLTPLGRQWIDQWQQRGSLPRANWLDRVLNIRGRWLRLPSWL